jgi:hypothetical protein
MFIDAPAFHAKHTQLAYLDYLEDEASGCVPFYAKNLFWKLQALLDNLVCGTRGSVSVLDNRLEPAVPAESSLWRERERAQSSFRKNMITLFSQRLRLHLNFEKSTVWYSYIYPGLGDLFNPERMKTDPEGAVADRSEVCMCMLPGIYSQEKTESGEGGKGEATIISKAVVKLF